MTKENQNIFLYAGDTKDVFIEVIDSDGVPLDLESAYIQWVVYEDVTGDSLIQKTSENSIRVEGSTFSFRILSDDTANLDDDFYHEAKIVDVSGFESTVMRGRFVVNPSYPIIRSGQLGTG